MLIKDKTVNVTVPTVTYKNENTGKVFKKPTKFDPNTGEPVSKIKGTKEEAEVFFGWYPVFKKNEHLNEDAFFEPAYTDCPKGYSLMISNHKSGCLCDPDDDYTQEISERDIFDTMASFSSFYKDELKALKKFYGEENVKVRFGLVNYSH